MPGAGNPLTSLDAEVDGRAHQASRAHSKSIKSLDIAGTKVTDAAVKYLQTMSSLRKIDIWKTQITHSGC